MGLRGAAVNRSGQRAPWLAALLVLSHAIASSTQAQPVDAEWWAELPRMAPTTSRLEAPRWYDALDVAAGITATTHVGSLAADLSVRARLDAPTYLTRVASERADLADIDAAVVRERAMHEQLAWLARRCEGMWRARQVQLIDAALARTPEATSDRAYLAALRRTVAIDASQPATPLDVGACRLSGVLDGVSLARDHPTLVFEATSRSLRERTEAVMAAPAPATAWIAIDLETGSTGRRADIRVGLDVPIPIREGSLDLTLSGDDRGVRGRVAWQRSGVAASATSHRRDATVPETSQGDTEERLVEILLRRRLEAELMRRDADRLWAATCGSATPTEVVACATVTADHSALHVESSAIDAVLRAIDAEIRALQATLGTIEASGHPLEAFVHAR